ncbi:tyrosine-type recombinase/integrase [Bacteroides uniformis]|uniref:Tyrosine-type recombinase/integrase n=1 Tax=Bacteroides uniformis TaxID=820 RepID=A0AAW6GKZ6_BACUN|nr:tyrosine-type recombinase/integrase [Bacteroides uniformis]MDC1879313.1 tyrosine-type recombinase/integrase [Bacteroides uniformis]MDC1883350.1 tyrosine-type recombinase/integrase [Bacteroides uniformis]
MAQYSALRCVFGIWQNNEKPLISNGLRFVVTCLQAAALWVLFHLARHTFATEICLTQGVPIESVSKMLGHTNIQTTQIYARVVDRKLSHDMAVLEQKLQSKGKRPIAIVNP